MKNRSSQATVRNPVLALPAVRRFRGIPPEARAALAGVLRELSADARQRANRSWASHKAPMAAYWKAVAVYARHIALAIEASQDGQ